MQTFRIQCTIDIEGFDERDAVKDFFDLVKDNSHLGFSNGQVMNVEELIEENE